MKIQIWTKKNLLASKHMHDFPKFFAIIYKTYGHQHNNTTPICHSIPTVLLSFCFFCMLDSWCSSKLVTESCTQFSHKVSLPTASIQLFCWHCKIIKQKGSKLLDLNNAHTSHNTPTFWNYMLQNMGKSVKRNIKSAINKKAMHI